MDNSLVVECPLAWSGKRFSLNEELVFKFGTESVCIAENKELADKVLDELIAENIFELMKLFRSVCKEPAYSGVQVEVRDGPVHLDVGNGVGRKPLMGMGRLGRSTQAMRVA
jgi:hypothetical protein